jgi:hypothetical protein
MDTPSLRESKAFAASFGFHTALRVHPGTKRCVKCGKTENLTKHHYNGSSKGPWDWMCRTPCHDAEHDMTPKELRTEEERQRLLKRRRELRAIKRATEPARIEPEPTPTWTHIADQWTQQERKEMLEYLDGFNMKRDLFHFPNWVHVAISWSSMERQDMLRYLEKLERKQLA